ncbi:cytochrome C biogenesis protein [Candidatus Woesearchaeota archaeon]|nr:cytochrome C biogenesis protein [Candidatus Woesearchaeota archaeon]
MGIVDFFSSFFLGLLTPLTAVCVLPLYPGFLAYMAQRFSGKVTRKHYAMLGSLITLGVIMFMFLVGILFTTVWQVSLTNIIGIVSPIAFSTLAIVSILLILDVDLGRFIPKAKVRIIQNPIASALIYGFFFGAIVIPCNPGFIAAFFARALLFDNPVTSMIHFLLFGLGLGFPLLLFSLLSARWSTTIISFATKHKTAINRSAGIIMLGISLYYLLFVFQILGAL